MKAYHGMRAGLAMACVAAGAMIVGCSDGSTGRESVRSVAQATKVCPGTQTVSGIDVSHWQGTINWTQVKADGQVWAIAKATQGTYFNDDQFAANWSGMQSAGVIRGAYHFIDWEDDAVAQAEYFVNAVNEQGGIQLGDLPPVLDVEETPNGSGGYQTPDVDKILPWLQRVECLTGRKPMIYTRATFIDPLDPPAALAGYPLWVAHYETDCPNLPALWSAFAIWQTGDDGNVNGISGNSVDMNTYNGSQADLLAFTQQLGDCGGSGGGGGGGAGGASGGSGGGGGGTAGGGGKGGSAGTAGAAGSSTGGGGAAGSHVDGGVGGSTNPSDAGQDGGNHAVPPAEEDSGCGCRAAGVDGGTPSSLHAIWILAVAWGMGRRWRKRDLAG